MEKVQVPAQVSEAIAAFRSTSTNGRHFIKLGYEGKNVLKVLASDAGFVAESVTDLPDNDAVYILVRTDHQVEKARTTKYAQLSWLPDSIPPMRKALISTHSSQIRELLQAHVSIQASQRSELTEDEVMLRIEQASGTKSNITTKAAFSSSAVDISRSAAKKEDDFIPSSAKSERGVQIKDEAAVRAAFKQVRDDADTTNWAMLGYTDTAFNVLELKSTGDSGVEGLIAAINASEPAYALFRTTDQLDKTTNVRFSFLRIVPTSLPPSKKANLSTLNGFISELFKPYSFDFDYSSLSDFSVKEVQEKISTITGIKNMSLTSNATSSSSTKISHPLGALSSPSKENAGPSSFLQQPSGNIELTPELQAALKSVRTDAPAGETQTQWVLAAKVDKKDSLSLLATGTTSSVEEILEKVEDSNLNFALLRCVDVIDNSQTIKFVYIRWQTENTPAMKKSSVSTKLGLYNAVFSPYHVEFFVANKSEITQAIVADKISAASGSKSRVVEKK